MPYTIPARISQRGRPIPEIIVDDEFADVVKETKWSVGTKGYVLGMVSKEVGVIRLHRYLWLLKHGECPKEIDHIDRNKLDNRIDNLRPASGTLNTLNRSQPVGRMPPGVAFRPRQKTRPYQSHVSFRHQWVSLGLFATPEDAGAVYQAMKFMLILV
jgi:hypothetical protein